MNCERSLLRLAMAGALVAALGLAACGRKGPLDPPPAAAAAAPAGDSRAAPIGSESTKDNPGVGPHGQAVAPKGPNKRIPLDVLLN
jgi:predicted small lipoprotein YifL